MRMKKANKTVGITIRFFTNDLPDHIGTRGNQIPFWTCGKVHLEANSIKGIKSRDEIFYYFDDIPRIIKRVMSKSGLVAVEDLKRSPIVNSIRAERRKK